MPFVSPNGENTKGAFDLNAKCIKLGMDNCGSSQYCKHRQVS